MPGILARPSLFSDNMLSSTVSATECFDDAFEQIAGDVKTSILAQAKGGMPLFHEAGVWLDSNQSVLITSNRLPRAYEDVAEGSILVSRVDVQSGTVTVLPPRTMPPMANGGCPYEGGALLCDQGYHDDRPSGLRFTTATGVMNPNPLVDNFYGKPFNSINDVTILRQRGTDQPYIWFTDPPYGFEQGFKDRPQLPPQLYCFNPQTGSTRAMADGFCKPNGLAFNHAGDRLYVTDTGVIRGDGDIDWSRPSSIYVFDVIWDRNNPFLCNRRLFAYAAGGAPDGIKIDEHENVYCGCFDGINVWNRDGNLIGRFIFTDEGGHQRAIANFCFIPGGRIVAMAEDLLFVVSELGVKGMLAES